MKLIEREQAELDTKKNKVAIFIINLSSGHGGNFTLFDFINMPRCRFTQEGCNRRTLESRVEAIMQLRARGPPPLYAIKDFVFRAAFYAKFTSLSLLFI